MVSFIQRVRERVNLSIYNSQKKVLTTVRYLTLFASLITVANIIYYYGYPHSPEVAKLLVRAIKITFVIFIFNYLIRFFYSFEPKKFIVDNWFEGMLVMLLIFDSVNLYFFGIPILQIIFTKMGVENFDKFYVIFLQLYILLLSLIDFVYVTRSIMNLKVKPAVLFLCSFAGLIFFGGLLLRMPEMTTLGSITFTDALFTSVSAVCVTGLTVVDTATYFTFKGQLVIMILIQLGGIGIITFASFFAFFLKQGVSIKHQTALHDYFSEESLYHSKDLIKQIVFYTLLIEFSGAFLIYNLWSQEMYFSDAGEKIFYSLFHSIAAFCNAGFALFSNGLMAEYVLDNYLLHLVIAGLIIFGGLGFHVLKDLFSIKNLRKRLQNPWKQWKTSTTIALYSSAGLIIGGALVFYFVEKNYVLEKMNFLEAIITSVFQSVTTRTAGFNTVDIGTLQLPTYIIFIFLMFIGASSGSTGGGIKTSTFVVIMLSVYSTIRGKKNLEFGRRTISEELLHRAFSILIFYSLFILLAIFLLSITDAKFGILKIAFETVSAFGTVGLSTGITPYFSISGKFILILCMFIGRIGTLTLVFALSSRVQTTSYKYPNTHLMIG